MGFPSKEVVSAGTEVKVAVISGTGNTPTLYTVTMEAAALLGATSISVSADTAFYLQHDMELMFGAVRAKVNIPDAAGLADGILVGTTPTTVPVVALLAPIADAATATTYELFQLLGITDASPQEQPQSEDTTDMKSGFGQKQTIVGINRTIQVNGIRIVGDRAMYEVIMPFLTDDDEVQKLIWVELKTSNGDLRKGPCRITDGSGQNQVRTSMKYNLTFTFQGNLFQFTSGDAALFV